MVKVAQALEGLDSVPRSQLLILREKQVVAEGLLELGVIGLFMPEFDLSEPLDACAEYPQWTDLIGKWEELVRAVVAAKGQPPRLY
jgi:hypothetical protein